MRKIILIGLMVFLLAIMAGCGGTQAPSNASQSQPGNKVQELAPASPEAITWNTKDLSIVTNGNVARAAKLVKAGTDKQSVTDAAPAAVIKTPWNYYGKLIEVTGVAEVVDDYPPGSDYSSLLGGGDAAEVVFETKDGTIADFLLVGSSGSLKIGETVTLRGYPVGREEVPNKIGGSFTHLILVGKYSK